ncbi:MAG: hypothetical protein COV29_03990 [Candidatus Yanofskybacteria bacterium CG10_big_fil_rev_8_21_14_0_10_36_16]|uniref:Type II secretion system protein GspG C-terminal domain-containing protein n=1 Tax=Candidatus Yanofskybacteria bacterium CG10_big_fil_rev_8_21_14_0_10_36_16 TaxID=1975096 RepID=A0A2J0Q6V0_9BACT|nr:MAG: hypothetical protein COV29_03990 [Candidatus Yanofskybacteria bacterium CG10_big_fil_rev_8_21_14_0_10_36_16]
MLIVKYQFIVSILNSIKNLFVISPDRKGPKGFTLVELLVVIAIIGILATLLLLQLAVARGKARDVKRIADVNQVRTALELWFDDNAAQYPATMDLYSDIVPKYIGQLPQDPLAAGGCNTDAGGNPRYDGTAVGTVNCYGYAYHPDGVASDPIRFQVWSQLEQWAPALGSDADIDSTGAGVNGNPWPAAGAGATVEGGLDDVTANCDDATPGDCIYDQGIL